MRIEIQLRIVGDDDRVISVDKVLHLDKSDDRLEAVGLSLSEGKAVMAGIQERVVTAQAASFLDRHRCCSGCGRALLSKGPGWIQVPHRLRHHPAEQSAPSPLPLSTHLCPAAPSAQLMASEALTTETPAVPRRPMRFVDAIVADFVAIRRPIEATGAPAASTAERTAPAMAVGVSLLAPAERNALRKKVRQEIAEARQLERNIPGAFVEVRRPH